MLYLVPQQIYLMTFFPQKCHPYKFPYDVVKMFIRKGVEIFQAFKYVHIFIDVVQ